NQAGQFGQNQIQSASLPAWATQRVSGQPYFQNTQTFGLGQQMNQQLNQAQMNQQLNQSQMSQMNNQQFGQQLQAGLPNWATQPIQGQPNFQTGQIYGQGQQANQQFNQARLNQQYGQQMQSGLPSWATQPIQGQP